MPAYGANIYTDILNTGRVAAQSKRVVCGVTLRHHVTPDCGVEFLTEEPLRKVYELKQTHDIMVVGGGKLLTSLIKPGCWTA